MKVLGHYVAGPMLLMALLDGSLFIINLYALGFAGDCQDCYFRSATHLELYEALGLTCAFLAITAGIGLYNRDALLEFRVFIRRFVLASQLVFIPTVAIIGIAKATTGAPFGWYMGVLSIAIALFFFVLFLIRVILLWAFDLTFLKRRVLVLGSSAESDAVANFIKTEGMKHLVCAGQLQTLHFFQQIPVSRGSVALSAQTDARLAPLVEVAQSLRAEEIVVATGGRRGVPMWQLLECKLQGIQITDYLSFWERETGQLDLEVVEPGWLALAQGFQFNWPRRVIKRIIDISIASSFLAATLPLWLLAAALIKLDSRGPVFYRQERVGRDGQTFLIWKFRSMRIDAEADGVPRWAAVKDDRTTRVGRLIRKARIDEFPQVLNVLKGDMSFIGPRPERPFFVEQLRKQIPLYDLRHSVRPGVTGWAQVYHHYGATIEDAKRKLAYDLYYVKNQDSILDMMILLQTVRVLLFSQGSR